MSVYYLLRSQSTTVTAAGITTSPPSPVVVPPPNPGTGSPAINQGIQVVVQAPGGVSVGAVVAIVASNDQSNWATVSTITIASGVGPQISSANLSLPYAAFGAFLNTITGAAATVTCTMSA